jgi:hypothetical protein
LPSVYKLNASNCLSFYTCLLPATLSLSQLNLFSLYPSKKQQRRCITPANYTKNMKKTYKALTQVALSSLLCLSLAIPASAQQRGAERAQGGGNSGGGGGGSAQPQRSTPPPAPAPQPQRYDPPPQVQRSAPQQQPQQQIQRNDPPQQVQRAPQVQQQQPQQVQQAPQVQRNNPQSYNNGSQQQGNSYSGRQQRPNATTPVATQRGAEHQTPLKFQPNNPNGGSRLYPNGQRGGNNNSGFNYRRGNNTSYRSYPGLRFGRNYVSPRPRGFYHNNRGYYRTYYTPQLGFSINTLPYGYYPFYYGTDQYYYSDGLYYTQQDDNYTVVEPPIGAVINKLPAKAQSITINGTQYYELNGVYYQPVTKDDGTLVYQIAGKDGELNTADETAIAPEDLPQVGDLVDHLPEGFRILKLNNQRYYVSQEGYYFQDAVDTDGERVFKIVATPNDTLEN